MAKFSQYVPAPRCKKVTALRAERKRQKQLQLQWGNKWPNSGLVVVDNFGNPPHPDTVTRARKGALPFAKTVSAWRFVVVPAGIQPATFRV